MRSPFEIFRKHQKELMVVTIGLAMFAFIILDSVSQLQSVPRELMVVLLALVMGFVFWVYGAQTAKKTGHNKQNQHAVIGLVLGAALGILWIAFNRPPVAVQTNAGNISEKEFLELKKEREIAVRFMQRAYESSVGTEPPISQMLLDAVRRFPQLANMPQFQQRQIWYQNLRQALFNHEPNQPVSRTEVVEKYLLLKEATKLGIRVNDDTVYAFLDKVTNKKLNQTAYLGIRKDLGVKNSELLRILRDELRAKIARTLLTPRGYRTPAQFWGEYRKLNVKQHIETATVPVKEFLDDVPAPKSQELQDFFTKYKKNYPQPQPSADPAFGINQQVNVAYLEADHAVAEAYVLKQQEGKFLSAEEIKNELKSIDDGIADVEQQIKDGTIKKDQVDKERAGARMRYLRRMLEAGGKINRFDFDVVKHYEENKSTQYVNPSWAPVFPEKLKESAHPSSQENGPVRAKRPRSATGAETPMAPKFPAGNAKPPAAKKTGAIRDGRFENSRPFVSHDGDFDAGLTAVAVYQPKAAKSETAKSKPPVKKIKVVQPPPPFMPGNPPARPFLLLTDELKMEIRDKLLEERTQAEISNRLDAAMKFMGRMAVEYEQSLEESGPSFDPKDAAAKLKAYADEHGLIYKTSGFLSGIEFANIKSSPVPFANDQAINIGGTGNHPSVIARLYSRDSTKTVLDERLYRVLRTPKYVLWKIGHKNERIPEFTEPGVKERVEKAWRLAEAAKLAEKRAKELAAQVRERGLPMDRALTGVTVTGDDKSHVIQTDSTKTRATMQFDPRISQNQRFSWLIDEEPTPPMSSAPNQRPRKIPPRRSRIPGMDNEKIGDEFMKTIFEELGDGDVGVAYNQDKSTYYVVRVFDRTPGGPDGRKSQMSQFLNEDLFVNDGQSVYQSIPNAPNYSEVLLREQLWLKYDVEILERKKEEDAAQ